MGKIIDIQNIRLSNLRLLHARPDGLAAGAPTSEYLAHFLQENGASINKNELSQIYCLQRKISDYLASSIERAFKLPAGWMSQDHEFVFSLNSGETKAIQSLMKLPDRIKAPLLSLITNLEDNDGDVKHF
jgi:hypothetical protein